MLAGVALGGIWTAVSTTGLGCRGGFRAGGALPEEARRKGGDRGSGPRLRPGPQGSECPLTCGAFWGRTHADLDSAKRGSRGIPEEAAWRGQGLCLHFKHLVTCTSLHGASTEVSG